MLVFQVYQRVFATIENIDPFKVMELVGVHKDDTLHCLDLIQRAQSEVLKTKREKLNTNKQRDRT